RNRRPSGDAPGDRIAGGPRSRDPPGGGMVSRRLSGYARLLPMVPEIQRPAIDFPTPEPPEPAGVVVAPAVDGVHRRVPRPLVLSRPESRVEMGPLQPDLAQPAAGCPGRRGRHVLRPRGFRHLRDAGGSGGGDPGASPAARSFDDHPAGGEEPLALAVAQSPAQGERGAPDRGARAPPDQAPDPRDLFER